MAPLKGRAPGIGEGDQSLGLGTAASPSPVQQPQAAEPGGSGALPWSWHIAAVLPGRAGMRWRSACLYLPSAAAGRQSRPRAVPSPPGEQDRPQPRGPVTILQPEGFCCSQCTAARARSLDWPQAPSVEPLRSAAPEPHRCGSPQPRADDARETPRAPWPRPSRSKGQGHFKHKPRTKHQQGQQGGVLPGGAVPVTGQTRREKIKQQAV